jgi:hypothetical protein
MANGHAFPKEPPGSLSHAGFRITEGIPFFDAPEPDDIYAKLDELIDGTDPTNEGRAHASADAAKAAAPILRKALELIASIILQHPAGNGELIAARLVGVRFYALLYVASRGNIGNRSLRAIGREADCTAAAISKWAVRISDQLGIHDPMQKPKWARAKYAQAMRGNSHATAAREAGRLRKRAKAAFGAPDTRPAGG